MLNALVLKINQEAKIKEIRQGAYLYFEEGIGGMPWNEFTLVKKESRSELDY